MFVLFWMIGCIECCNGKCIWNWGCFITKSSGFLYLRFTYIYLLFLTPKQKDLMLVKPVRWERSHSQARQLLENIWWQVLQGLWRRWVMKCLCPQNPNDHNKFTGKFWRSGVPWTWRQCTLYNFWWCRSWGGCERNSKNKFISNQYP